MVVKKEVNSLRSWELKRTIHNSIVHFNFHFNSHFNSPFNSLYFLFSKKVVSLYPCNNI